MNTTETKSRQRKARPKVGRVIRRLLAAVDRSIAAAEQAKQARDELEQLVEHVEAGQ